MEIGDPFTASDNIFERWWEDYYGDPADCADKEQWEEFWVHKWYAWAAWQAAVISMPRGR